MKKFLFRVFFPVLLFLYLIFPPLAVTATAQAAEPLTPKTGSYACVLTDDAYFYSAANANNGLFLLPKTYYVRLLSYGSGYCKVEYLQDDAHTQKLTGYVQTENLAFVDYVPQRPYLYYVFDVKYRLDDLPQDAGNSFTEITLACAYYGDYPIGSERWCYVLREGEFGYIPKPADLSFEENTEYADYLASLGKEETSAAAEEKTNASSPAQIAILVTLCLLVPLLAALILKPPRRPPYETND